MLRRLDNRIGHYTLLLLVGLWVFMVNLGGPSLWDVDEGRNSASACEMMASGNWIVPTFNGEMRDHKPALLYWLQMAAFRVFGINEFAARFPSALAALLTVLLTYELGRSLFNKTAGLLAGLVVSSTLLLGMAAHFANPDALLNLFTVLTFCLFWWCYSRTRRFPHLLCGLGCGLAVMAKGPVGVVLPCAALFLYLVWIRDLRAMFTRRLFLGIFSFAVVALPWYVLVGVETKAEFLKNFFMRHNVERFINPMESHDFGPLFYLLVLVCGLAPWSAFLGSTAWCGFWSAIRTPWARFRPWWEAARDDESSDNSVNRYRFLWSWLSLYLVFFSVAATKLPNYILPATVPLAILTARMLDRWRTGNLRMSGWVVPLGLTCFGLVGFIGAGGMLVASGALPWSPVRVPSFPGLERWAIMGLVPIAGAGLCGWFWQRNRSAALACLPLSAVFFVAPLLSGTLQIMDGVSPARPLVALAGARQPDQEIRIVNYRLDHLASLHFYTQRGVHYCGCDEQVLDWLRSPLPVYLFLPAADWDRLRPLVTTPWRVLGTHRDLHKGFAEVVVITNQSK